MVFYRFWRLSKRALAAAAASVGAAPWAAAILFNFAGRLTPLLLPLVDLVGRRALTPPLERTPCAARIPYDRTTRRARPTCPADRCLNEGSVKAKLLTKLQPPCAVKHTGEGAHLTAQRGCGG